ncbi:MAG: hypothetical protein ACTXOO_01315 [Sodalis sp. (in: enterobacteria)]
MPSQPASSHLTPAPCPLPHPIPPLPNSHKLLVRTNECGPYPPERIIVLIRDDAERLNISNNTA